LNNGYAFLRGPDRLSLFIYAGDLDPPADFDILHEGQKVTFEPQGKLNKNPEAKNNGLRAVKVRIA